jgi:hypothetical protein
MRHCTPPASWLLENRLVIAPLQITADPGTPIDARWSPADFANTLMGMRPNG